MRGPHSVRTYLVGLIVVVLVPLLVFSGFLVLRAAEHEQDVTAVSVRYRARIAADAIGSEVGVMRARLFVLAGGLSLETTDLPDFHARARQAFGDMAVILSDASGEEILNTSIPYGDTLPRNPNREALRYVVDTKRPRIADMARDPSTGNPFVTINVPVTKDSRLVYVLSLDISSMLPRVLAQLHLPPGWVAAIFDRSGVMIARNRDPELYVGQLGHPDFLAHVRTEDEGWFPGISREGIPLFTAFAHTTLGGWTINIGIPRDTLLAPVRETTEDLLLLGAITLAFATGLSVFLGHRIAQPVTGLVPLAEAVGAGEAVGLRQTSLIEANVVARSLYDASERLQRAATERRIATEALRQNEQKYRLLAEDLARVDQERTELVHRTVVAQEEERKRIARELHDSLAQYLTALRLGLNALIPSCQQGPLPREALDHVKSLTGKLGRTVNRIAWELRPVALDELGLRRAVEHYLEEWSERANMPVDIEISPEANALPPVVATTLFRVLQEATANVMRHAAASRVGVILDVKDQEVRMIVEDDGKGFAADPTCPGFVPTRQLGLVGMRERLALVGGALEVESAPDCGTTLYVRIPLEQRHAAS